MQDKNSKRAIVISTIIQKIELICGIALCGFWGIGFIVLISAWDLSGFIITTIFFTIGLLLLWASHKRKKLIKSYNEYVVRISADPSGAIENLASSLGTSQEIVKKNIELMISKKYLSNTYVNKEENRIVAPEIMDVLKSMNNISDIFNVQQPNVEYTSLTCKSCGGVNKVQKDTASECEFCGNVIV